ncbi:BlaI/MecI/CopY family transcriptional regulator [Tessaracoccus sp. HDW20]|nr:BlaI/MecI/CopY family transcriptional regulator [Tessaracoccus coleopterorum]NHB85305.1 BlaI/MecI/CopY family transcriptional regulator [Tessaracoccus coleopterorum]
MASRGELEQRVMELLWGPSAPRTVADVHQQLSAERELAYTTVMTVLDRLAKKGLVKRELVARAWQYRAASSQAVVIAGEMAALLAVATPEVRVAALRELTEGLSAEERAALGESADAL